MARKAFDAAVFGQLADMLDGTNQGANHKDFKAVVGACRNMLDGLGENAKEFEVLNANGRCHALAGAIVSAKGGKLKIEKMSVNYVHCQIREQYNRLKRIQIGTASETDITLTRAFCDSIRLYRPAGAH